MNIVHKIKSDFSRREQLEQIDVVQGDSMSRTLEIKLYNYGIAYQVPQNSILQIAYCKPDRTCGLYDRLPSGEIACTAEGNAVIAILHPQMFTVAGTVYCELRMMDQTGRQLTTFKWIMNVADSVVNKMQSEDYYNFRVVHVLSVNGIKPDGRGQLELNAGGIPAFPSNIPEFEGTVDDALERLAEVVFGSAFVKKINGAPPNAKGEIYLAGEDIHTFPANIPDFAEGTVDEALERLAEVVFEPALSKFRVALQSFADEDDVVGIPVLDTGSGECTKVFIQGTHEELDGDRRLLSIPTVAVMYDALRHWQKTGYNDVTEIYLQEKTTGGVGSAKEYLWSLGHGEYAIHVDADINTPENHFYLKVLRGEDGILMRLLYTVGDELTVEIYYWDAEIPLFKFEGSTGKIYIFGEELSSSPDSDGAVSAEKIKEALGYTPMNASKVVQGPGESSELVMSQKAVTKMVNDLLSGDLEEYPTVDSLEEMVDTAKDYILSSTGTIWRYQTVEVETETEMTEQIVGTTDNPWGAGRLSSGNPNGTAGYVTTPFIDVGKYTAPFVLHLKGITFSYATPGSATVSNLRYSQYSEDKTHLCTELSQASSFGKTYWNNSAVLTDVGDGTLEIAITPPVTQQDGDVVKYVRFSGYGTEANANVYVSYIGKSTSYTEAWADTGIVVAEITEFAVVNSSVKSFMASGTYSDTDYSGTKVTSYCAKDYFRKDFPLPVLLKWDGDFAAVDYAVSIGKTSGFSASSGIVYHTKDTELAIYHLIPNTTYYYKIHALLATGDSVMVKEGSFSTMTGPRLLKIDGIQNVRDVGGYVGFNGQKVKYGLIFRGSAMDEDATADLHISGDGVREMLSLGIGTDVDLRYGHTESPLGVDYIKTQYGYENYASAFTVEAQRTQFKTLLEAIVTQLTDGKPVYIHCQGGCDRTGTLVFQLLGLLGVSESDLAKEYELSSFSAIGYTRTRNSDKYRGMVDALKSYSGNTITAKFEAFAMACGIAEGTITSYRSLMLQ